MGINEIIMYIMMFFMLIAAVDRILSQFGGSARFLGKFGKSIEGSGGQFEEGFMAMCSPEHCWRAIWAASSSPKSWRAAT